MMKCNVSVEQPYLNCPCFTKVEADNLQRSLQPKLFGGYMLKHIFCFFVHNIQTREDKSLLENEY